MAKLNKMNWTAATQPLSCANQKQRGHVPLNRVGSIHETGTNSNRCEFVSLSIYTGTFLFMCLHGTGLKTNSERSDELFSYGPRLYRSLVKRK